MVTIILALVAIIALIGWISNHISANALACYIIKKDTRLHLRQR